jgi:hypothetical protein
MFLVLDREKKPVNAICIETGRRDVKGSCPDHGGDGCLVNPQISYAERTGGFEAMEVLFSALNWSSGGLGSAALEIVERLNNAIQQRDRLEEAIKEHRSQKADDRCIEDDDRLYASLGDGIKCDRSVGSKEEMLKNCERFIENRCVGGTWPTYAELERRVKELESRASEGMRKIGPETEVEIIRIHRKVECEED